jgi:hypothetical protein
MRKVSAVVCLASALSFRRLLRILLGLGCFLFASSHALRHAHHFFIKDEWTPFQAASLPLETRPKLFVFCRTEPAVATNVLAARASMGRTLMQPCDEPGGWERIPCAIKCGP